MAGILQIIKEHACKCPWLNFQEFWKPIIKLSHYKQLNYVILLLNTLYYRLNIQNGSLPNLFCYILLLPIFFRMFMVIVFTWCIYYVTAWYWAFLPSFLVFSDITMVAWSQLWQEYFYHGCWQMLQIGTHPS